MAVQYITHQFEVDYSCPNCVATITNLMKHLPYVRNCTTNFLAKTLSVEMDASVAAQSVINEIKKKGKNAKLIPVDALLDTEGTDLILHQNEFDFEIDVAPGFRDQFQTLFFFNWCERIFVDHESHRLRVIVKPGFQARPKDVFETLKNHIQNKVIQIRSIPPNDRFFLFSIKGIQTEQEAELVRKKLEELGAFIKQVHVNYSTRAVSILANIEDDKILDFNRKLNNFINNIFNNRRAELIPATPLEGIKQSVAIAPKTYFRRAFLNMIFVLPLIFLGGYIPLSVTIFGQLVGLVLGGITFSMMWKTGHEFYKEAWTALVRDRSFNMYSLIALGTGSAWLYSMILVLAPGLFPMAALSYQFTAVGMILGIINFGRGIRVRAEELTNKMVQNLSQVYAQNQPQLAKRVAHTITDVEEARILYEEINYRNIKEGDVILVNVEERFPCEGTIISNTETTVEQAALTGESGPVYKKINDSVYSGSKNNRTPVLIRATCDGPKGNLTRVMQEVAKASAQTPAISRLVDKIANIFVPSIIGISVLSALGWLFLGPVPQIAWMIKSAMSVLLCACPCAMGLSVIPMSIGVKECLNRRILVRDATALEALAEVDAVVWDKTGTLTTPGVEAVYIGSNEYTENEVLTYVASVEKAFLSLNNDHPIAQCLVNKSASNELFHCESFESNGQGVLGIVEDQFGIDKSVAVGSLSYLETLGIEVAKEYRDKEDAFAQSGKTSIFIAIEKECVSVVALQHILRNDAKLAIDELKELNIDVFMLTGDKKEPALDIAQRLGIPDSHVMFERDKEKKRDEIINLRTQLKRKVAFIGDGFNDSLALNEADVSIGVGAWTSAAAHSKIALQKLNVATAVIVARETMNNIRQNLYWTGFYNFFSIAAAAGLFYRLFGFVLNPVIASFSMAFSSVCVLVNSMRLTFEVDEKLAIHQRRLSRPSTFLEKAKNFLSLKSLFRTIEMLLSMTQEVTHVPASIVPKHASTLGQNSPKKKVPSLPRVAVSPSMEESISSPENPPSLTRQTMCLTPRKLVF